MLDTVLARAGVPLTLGLLLAHAEGRADAEGEPVANAFVLLPRGEADDD